MRRKKNKAIALILFMLLSRIDADAQAADRAPEISAASAVLMELDTGLVLYSRDAERPMPIASITKIMTGLLASECCDPEETIMIQPEWVRVEGSNMGLQPGECCRAEDLLYGLMLASGNDAAVALACHIAGDIPSFAQRMNDRAAELGMTGTSFMNPHGLTQEGHYSTARDMGILACAAMRDPRFRTVVSSKTANAGGHTLRNHNKLLWDYPGAIGVKTGYTEAAGQTLVSCAERGGMTLVCVTLNDPLDWKDHAALLDWGFSAFVRERPEIPPTLQVISGRKDCIGIRTADLTGLVVSRESRREWRILLPPFVYAPCEEGDALGTAELLLEGEPVYACVIEAAESAELNESMRLSFWERLLRLVRKGAY